MIVILHGDDITRSRNRYVELKKASKNPLVLDGASITLADIVQTFSNELLFAEKKDIFIENFFAKKKLIAKETKEIIDWIQKNPNEELVFWESKKLTPAALKSFPKAKEEHFPLPQTLFKFIDSIGLGKEALPFFHSALAQSEPELIFFLMIRQLRILLALALGSHIDELKTLAPWQLQNLNRQRQYFSLEKLKSAYKNLLNIDLAQKTGGTALSLVQSIDIFLLGL